MPLFSHQFLEPEGEIGLWKIEEDEDFFVSRLQLAAIEQEELDKIKGHRRLEWLASRWLLHHMSGRTERAVCLKDKHGKPYLPGSFYDISFSHSNDLVSVIACPNSVGIDIQKIVEKIHRIEHKFMRDDEMTALTKATRLEELHVYWGAKEALYKAYGRREVDFKAHIKIEAFEFNNTEGITTGRLHKAQFNQLYQIYFKKIEHYILVYALAIDEPE